MDKQALKAYRGLIGDAWLPVVGRRRLTSHEYALIERWFKSSTPAHLILRAIQMCADRARQSNNTIYSLGVIQADLMTVLRQDAKTKVGTQHQAGRLNGDWRAAWDFDLREIRELARNTEAEVKLTRLIEDLPSLKEERYARERFAEISPLLK